MREKGIKVPKELEDRIKADPELMAILEKAQESGKYDEAQTEMHKKILQLVNDHPDEFTEEDLKVLLSATQPAAGPASAKEPTPSPISFRRSSTSRSRRSSSCSRR